MISKQLFISFLFLCSFCVPISAFKPDVLNAKGVGVPFGGLNNNSLAVEDFSDTDFQEEDPGAVTTPTIGGVSEDYIFPEPISGASTTASDDDQELGDSVITQSNAGSPGIVFPDDGITQSNVGLPDPIVRKSNNQSAQTDANERHEMPHTHEELVHRYMKEASVKMHKAWHLALQHPKHIIAGTAGIMLMRLVYAGWQQYDARYHINAVLKKYGKDLSCVSSIQARLLKAAYNKDLTTMQNYIAQYGLEPLDGPENAWIIPALETLCNR